MMLNRIIVPLLAVGLAGALGACDAGNDTPARDAPLDEPRTGDSVEALAPTPGELTPINRSGVRGRAEIRTGGDGAFMVRVEADSLEPGGRYTAHIHEGRCADGGPSRLPLGRITATGEGTGSIRMRVDADRLPAEADLFVQLHAPDDRPVACANLDAEDQAS